MINRKLMIGVMVTSLMLLVIGFLYEAPLAQRGVWLVGFSIMFIIVLVGLWMMAIRDSHKEMKVYTRAVGLLLLVVVIVLMEYLSRFAINYFYHMLYMEILMVLIWVLDNTSRRFKYIGVAIVYGASLIKFIPLLMRVATLGNVVSFGFVAIIEGAGILLLLLSRAYGQELSKTRELYDALDDAYEQLEAYSSKVQELTEREARLSIARDLHDTLGHEMTGLIMQLEMSKRMAIQKRDTVDLLDEGLISARAALRQIREIVETLRQDSESQNQWTLDVLDKLVSDYMNKTGKKVYLWNRLIETTNPVMDKVICRVVQEALTNVAKHSQTKQVTIYLYHRGQNEDKVLCCDIEEKGPDKDYINQRCQKGYESNLDVSSVNVGNGLKGMKERVVAIGGTLIYGNEINESQHFFIGVEIPYTYQKRRKEAYDSGSISG